MGEFEVPDKNAPAWIEGLKPSIAKYRVEGSKLIIEKNLEQGKIDCAYEISFLEQVQELSNWHARSGQ